MTEALKGKTENSEQGDRVGELRSLHTEALATLPRAQADVQAMKDEIDNDDNLSPTKKMKMKLQKQKLQTVVQRINRDLEKFDEELKKNGVNLEQESKDEEEADLKENKRLDEEKANIEFEKSKEQINANIEVLAQKIFQLWKEEGGVYLNVGGSITKSDHPDFSKLYEESDKLISEIQDLAKAKKAKKKSWITYGLGAMEDEMKKLQKKAFENDEKIKVQNERHKKIVDEFNIQKQKINDELLAYRKVDDTRRQERYKVAFTVDNEYNDQRSDRLALLKKFPFAVRSEDGNTFYTDATKLFEHYDFDF